MFSDLECGLSYLSSSRIPLIRPPCFRPLRAGADSCKITSTPSTCATNSTKCVHPSCTHPHDQGDLADEQFVLPEMIAHAFLTLCFLLSGQFLAFLFNAPLVGYNVNKSVNPQMEPKLR